MEKMNDLKDLLKHEIEDLCSVEDQILEALPAMIEKAGNPALKNALSEHLRITETHRSRLNQVQEIMGAGKEEEAREKKGFLSGIFSGKQKCRGMEGIIEEGNKIMGANMEPAVLDAAIIACAQKVEHYEICGYGTARTYARELGLEKAAQLLEQTLNEEYQADDKLTQLAVSNINIKAEGSGAGSGSGDRSASGSSATGRSGRSAKEKVPSREAEMEPATNRRSGSTSSRTEKASGRPKAAETPRNTGTARNTPTKKRVSNSRESKSSTNSRSTSGRQSASGTRGSAGKRSGRQR